MDTVTTRGAIRRVAMLGNHLPRHCGIATFTSDLSQAISDAFPELDSFVLAMNDAGKHHSYPPRVRFELAENDLSSYHRAADFLNVNAVGVLSVQHEYGIFGGKAGAHVLSLLREVRMPIVTTVHTILAQPDRAQRAVMDELCALSERIVVMSANGAELLRDVHRVPPRKIDLIPHGIPLLPLSSSSKDKLGVQGKSVLLTFGLLSPDKGLEYVVDALPEIVKKNPDAIYIVLGATHPHVKDRDGEMYRLMLENRAYRLGVDTNLIFHNRFVSHAELVEFLSAADIYITPYLNAEQITSGTLAYAVGSGKSVISTPYRYARELLADGRGVLVPWRDAHAIATEVNSLIRDDARRLELQRRAAAFGRGMSWPIVARAYVQSFQRASVEHRGRLRSSFQASTVAKRPAQLPEINLAHLRILTDDTGVLQHAAFNVPRYEDGYCLDDNARALVVASLVEEGGTEPAQAVRVLASRYLAFVRHAFDADRGRFRNFMTHSRQWVDEVGSEDSHGRAVWALGTVIARSSDHGRKSLCRELLHAALPAVLSFTSPRAWAYVLLGIDEYLRAFQNDNPVRAMQSALAERLHELFLESSHDDWPWFEDRLTYCNPRLPQALILSGASTANEKMVRTGLRSLEWLAGVQTTTDGSFAPIGSNGFYVRGGSKAAFDQQPVEACAMVSACLEAHRVSGQKSWSLRARQAFNWFLGQNHLQQSVYDPATGGCRDGLHAERLNENQGAESTLSFLMSLFEMRLADRNADSQPASSPRFSNHATMTTEQSL